jgi:hypothetical protein
MRNLSSVLALALLCACSPNTPTDAAAPAAAAPAATTVAAPAPATVTPPAPAASATLPSTASAATPAFVDKVWRVAPSSAQQPGTTYTFLSGGALVIDAPGGTPMTGSWKEVDGRLVMVEEGVAYPTDVVEVDAGHLVLRSHNPGEAVLIQLVAAPDQPLPQPATR